MNKLFLVAGTSVLAGLTKVRFANDMGRVEVLEKNEHTDIKLIELDNEMTKAGACKFLLAHEDFQGEAEQTAIKNYVIKNAVPLAIELGLVQSPESKAAEKAAAKAAKAAAKAAEKEAAAVARAEAKAIRDAEKAAAKAAAEAAKPAKAEKPAKATAPKTSKKGKTETAPVEQFVA